MHERIEREKEYHNKAFSEGLRKKADKFYSIHKNSLAELNKILEAYSKNKDVLEYGCGQGQQAFFLARYARHVTGIDISDYAIEQGNAKAKSGGFKNIEFKEMNAENMDFEDNSFDLIFGNSVLHHLDIEKSYKEINRVLKPGGKAVFYEPLGHNFIINLYRRATPGMRTDDEHPLLIKDINTAKIYFDTTKASFFHLTTFVGIPFRNTRFFDGLQDVLSYIDRKIFYVFPFLRKQAWFCILEFGKS